MFSTRTMRRAAVVVPLVAVVGVGGLTLANEDEGGGEAPPGEPVLADPDPATLDADGNELIDTAPTAWDSTTLSKFIPGRSMKVAQGAGAFADVENTSDGCVYADASSGGDITSLFAPVELPDGSQIKRVIFHGDDNAAAQDITINLMVVETRTFPILSTPPTRSDSSVDSFSTSGVSAGSAVVVAGAANLDERVGTPPGSVFGGFPHRFHYVEVDIWNIAGVNHLVCGIEIQYQVPAASPGVEFHPITPMRVFDSRIDTYAESGMLAPNASKVVSIKDGYDLAGVAIPALANAVPDGATAVTFNVTVAQTTANNFVAVTPGDATEYGTSMLNYGPGSALANSATVAIAADRTIKVWGGNQAGSAHVLIDITGYYAPAVPGNMAN